MIWDGKRLSEITESDLRKILESGIEEHKHLECKAELYSTTDAGKKDFLIDICAFANAEGGILLIGIPEQRDSNAQPTGVPDLDKFTGIDSANPESLLLSYDSRVASGIEERLPLESSSIKVENGRYIFAMRIPNSLSKPHCVRLNDKLYFPMRGDRHLYYMDIQEIKDLVMRTASRQEVAEQCLLSAMKSVHIPTDSPYLFITAIPIFNRSFLVDLRSQQLVAAMRSFDLSDIGDDGICKYSFEGLQRTGEKTRRDNSTAYERSCPT